MLAQVRCVKSDVVVLRSGVADAFHVWDKTVLCGASGCQVSEVRV